MKRKKPEVNKVRLENVNDPAKQFLPGVNKNDTVYIGSKKAKRSDHYAALN